jgi:hypothetical protein
MATVRASFSNHLLEGPVQPIVIPTFAYLEHFAHLPDRKFEPVVFYEPIFFLSP